MRITVISVGKKPDSHSASLIGEYEKRLKSYAIQIEWRIIAGAGKDKIQQSHSISKSLQPADYVILLDESGIQLSSPTFAAKLEQFKQLGRPLVFIIGGAYGVDDSVRKRADLCFSLGPLVFPHQLVRVLLIEQLYRASSITAGGAYHHG
jgi:23S rRNA (pseudouridine1915-N3)-methyltransferase